MSERWTTGFMSLRNTWVLLLFLAAQTAFVCVVHTEEKFTGLPGSRPNIIFFLADDQSRSDHRIYGNLKAPTPITEAFSRQALVFNKAYTGQAICAPSRSMLLTGLYPIRNGCFINHTAIRPSVKTLPAYLKPLGYDVILAGKSHLKPNHQFPWTNWYQPVRKPGYPRPGLPIAALDRYFDSREKPFCLILASEYPHGPYFKESSFEPDSVALAPFQQDSPGTRAYVSRYYQSIVEKENEFEAVLRLLEKHGLENDTIVFYADDHGVARGKFTVYDSGLNVAYMVRWPGKIIPGRSDAIITFADFVPTVIDLASSSYRVGDHAFDGKSLLPVLEGRAKQHHQYAYAVSHNQGIQNRHVFPQRSIHDGRYHYIYNFNSNEHLAKLRVEDALVYFFLKQGADKHPNQPEEELYDVAVDPFELVNLAKDPDKRWIKERLKRELFAWMGGQDDFLTETSTPPFFKVWRHELDENAPQFNYSIPADKVGRLAAFKLDPHSIGGATEF